MPPSPSTHVYEATRLEVTLEVSHQDFTRALDDLMGRTDLEALSKLKATSPEALRAKLTEFVGPLEFSLFQKLDHGQLLGTFTGRPARATTYVFGNALIAIEMTRHEPRVGLYVPLRMFVQEVAERRVIVTYDQPSALMAQFGSPEVDAVARDLDAKVVRLIDAAVRRGRGDVS